LLSKLKSTLFLKFIIIVTLLFFTLFLVSYALFNNFIIEHISIEKLDLVMDDFYTIWLEIGISFFILLTIALYVFSRTIKKITTDISSLTLYLEKISNKQYDSIIKIENYIEFLQLSMHLKNLVKRLQQKDKKQKKKS